MNYTTIMNNDTNSSELSARKIATLKKNLKNQYWRLNNLYYITDKRGKRVKFKMTREQLAYYEGEHNRNIILKARQLGFTTEVCIIQLDAALFEGKKCALIAHTLHDAKRLFREKVKFAYDNLPSFIKNSNTLELCNTDELVFAKGGSVTVSTSFRGGTLQRLHISEFGKICAKFPEKAKEIITGALQAVSDDGVVTFESTAEGRAGYFYEYCQEAQKIIGKQLSKQQFKFFFFSWYENPAYQADELSAISDRLTKYFDKLEKQLNIIITPAQRCWYAHKEKELGSDIKREYPSTPKEAFEQAIEGAYYSQQFQKLYAEKHIVDAIPDNKHVLFNTYWDLGVGDSTSIWFIKKVGNEYHIIDFYENSGEGLEHYVKVLKDRGYKYDKHYAPHDIDNRTLGAVGAKSLKQIAAEGFDIDGEKIAIKFVTVAKTSIASGIEHVRSILPKCYFDNTKCEQGLAALESYRKEWDSKAGAWKDNPLHDWSSHAADAFRYFAVAETSIKPATKLAKGKIKLWGER